MEFSLVVRLDPQSGDYALSPKDISEEPVACNFSDEE
jgi:hypothetical protein